MENKFRKFIFDNKGFVVFYLIWFFLHLILIANGEGEAGDPLWPFGGSEFDMDDYGVIDFLFYLAAPILIFFLWKLIGSDIKKKFN
jgi:hypothetical protein